MQFAYSSTIPVLYCTGYCYCMDLNIIVKTQISFNIKYIYDHTRLL